MLALWMGTSAACRGRGFEIESRKLKNQQRSSALFLNVSRRSPSCTSRIYIWKKNCSVVIAAFLRVNPVDSFSRGGCSERKYMCTQTHTLREVLQATEVRFHQHPLSSCSNCRPCSETFAMFCRLFLIIKKNIPVWTLHSDPRDHFAILLFKKLHEKTTTKTLSTLSVSGANLTLYFGLILLKLNSKLVLVWILLLVKRMKTCNCNNVTANKLKLKTKHINLRWYRRPDHWESRFLTKTTQDINFLWWN